MPVVLKCCGRHIGGMVMQATANDGLFLAKADLEAHGGVGDVTFTDDWHKALQFMNTEAAFNFIKRSPQCKPIREDGKPNRPLTATNWSIEWTETL